MCSLSKSLEVHTDGLGYHKWCGEDNGGNRHFSSHPAAKLIRRSTTSARLLTCPVVWLATNVPTHVLIPIHLLPRIPDRGIHQVQLDTKQYTKITHNIDRERICSHSVQLYVNVRVGSWIRNWQATDGMQICGVADRGPNVRRPRWEASITRIPNLGSQHERSTLIPIRLISRTKFDK